MMTGKVVATYSTQGQVNKNSTTENELLTSTSSQYSSVEVATAVTFTVALIQVQSFLSSMHLINLNLNLIDNYLSWMNFFKLLVDNVFVAIGSDRNASGGQFGEWIHHFCSGSCIYVTAKGSVRIKEYT